MLDALNPSSTPRPKAKAKAEAHAQAEPKPEAEPNPNQDCQEGKFKGHGHQFQVDRQDGIDPITVPLRVRFPLSQKASTSTTATPNG